MYGERCAYVCAYIECSDPVTAEWLVPVIKEAT